MELFNKFRETKFLKEDSDLEKQLKELKSIRDKLNNTEEIDRDIRMLEYGIKGEEEIAFELKNADIGMYVLHDITYECNGNKAQIDYLIFTKGYFYLIECKNLFGNITVDSNGQFYREYEYNGKHIKEAIYSPYTQAVRHHNMMKKIWSYHHDKLDNLLFGNLKRKDFFRPIVVLANSKSLLNTEQAPREIKENVIRADKLIDYIEKDIKKISPTQLCSERLLERAALEWKKRSTINTTNMANKYLKTLEDTIKKKEDLEKELKAFRKKKSALMNIPAYYIFTDKEMKKIIDLSPKTTEELISSKIMSDTKIKCHGDEIIGILNKINE